MSCRFAAPCELIGRPCSSSAVSLLMLALSECRSSTFDAIGVPLALYQGPLPIRSRALTSGIEVLRYARHGRLPAPAFAASVWQCLSAPANPPRLPPIPEPVLLTKKLMDWPCAVTGADTGAVSATPSAIMTSVRLFLIVLPPFAGTILTSRRPQVTQM